MNYPGSGWPQGNPPPGYGGYGPQPNPGGYPPPNPGGYGPMPGFQGFGTQRPSTAPAYLAALLFAACSALSYVLAFVCWSHSSRHPDMAIALVGSAFTEQATGNIDFAVSATITVASTVLAFTLVLVFRVPVVRWILAVLGIIVFGYYVYALIRLLSLGGGQFVGTLLAALLLWLAATVVAMIPPVGRAMRGYRPRAAGGGYWN